MHLWYLRRAVPWAALLGCLLAGAVLVGLARRWDSVIGLALPLAALLAVSATAFVYDEPAVAVTTVTPRGRRWAVLARLGAGGAVLALGLGLLLAVPGPVDGPGWGLLLAGAGGTVLLIALAGSRRQLPRPGATIASVVVLLGMAPLVLGTFLDLGSPYPMPELTDRLTALWVGTGTVAWLGIALLLSRPLGKRRTPGAARCDVIASAVPEPGVHR